MDDAQDELLSRRRVLQSGAVLVAAAALPSTSAFASPTATSKQAAPATRFIRRGYRRRRFTPHVGSAVKLRPHGGAAVRAQLAAVEDVPHVQGLAGAGDAYILRFRGPADQPLAAGIVGVRHKHFGTLQLYITPTPPDGARQDYLAAINRRIPRNARRA